MAKVTLSSSIFHCKRIRMQFNNLVLFRFLLEPLINSQQISGVGKIVEIDDAKFGKPKFNRGPNIEGNWVLESEHESKNIFWFTWKIKVQKLLWML